MKHILLLMLFCLPCSIFALNWFDVCGSTWTVSISSCEPDDPISYSQYSIGESATISGHDCKEYLCNGEMLYYVYTEGEKVYCIRPGAEDESLLLYDFGLNVGDEITVDIVCRGFNTSFDPHSRQMCVGSGIISSCGHTYEYLEMCELYDGETEPDDFSWHGIWIKGLGGTNFLGGEFANWGYDLVGGGANLQSVVVNGETIYSISDMTVGIPCLSEDKSEPIYNLSGSLVHDIVKGFCICNGKIILCH